MGRNWRYGAKRGRTRRLEAEHAAYHGGEAVPSSPPLFSHDATIQSYFSKGWHSVTACDIAHHLSLHPRPTDGDFITRLRSLKVCHFPSSQA